LTFAYYVVTLSLRRKTALTQLTLRKEVKQVKKPLSKKALLKEAALWGSLKKRMNEPNVKTCLK